MELPGAGSTLHIGRFERQWPAGYILGSAEEEVEKFELSADEQLKHLIFDSDPEELIEEEGILAKEIRDGEEIFVVDHVSGIDLDGTVIPSPKDAIAKEDYKITREGVLLLRSLTDEWLAREQGSPDTRAWAIYQPTHFYQGILTMMPINPPVELRLPLAELHR